MTLKIQVGANFPAGPAPSGKITVTTATFIIPSTATEIFVSFAGPVTLTLPDAASWNANNSLGLPLRIMDISGAAATNNITINRAGADTIDGLTSLTISGNYGAFALRVTPSSNWVIVG